MEVKCFAYHIKRRGFKNESVFYDGYIEAINEREAKLRLFDIYELDSEGPEYWEVIEKMPLYSYDFEYIQKYPLFLYE